MRFSVAIVHFDYSRRGTGNWSQEAQSRGATSPAQMHSQAAYEREAEIFPVVLAEESLFSKSFGTESNCVQPCGRRLINNKGRTAHATATDK